MESVSFPEINALERGKSKVLLTFFHALRYPGLYEPTFYLEKDLVIGGTVYFARGEHETAERDIIDPNTSSREKSRQILEQFKPVGRALGLTAEEWPYQKLVSFCDENLSPRDRVYLSGPDWLAGRAADILPPEDVVRAMVADTLDGRKQICPALERFVEEITLSRQN